MRELVKRLEEQITESESSNFEVGDQRERNHRYQTLQPLGNEQRGRSHYVDPSVPDAVEAKKALFHETFLSNRQTVMFTSGGGQAPHEADAKTAYAMQVLRKNKHEQLFRDGWHDAFVAKREVIMVYWKEDTREISLDVSGAQPQQLPQIISQQGQVVDVDESQLQQGPQGLQGSLTVTVDDSHVAMELIQPERFYRDPMGTYPSDSQWCSVERDVPRGTLIMDGYDEEQVMSLSVDYRFRSDEEDAARKSHDQSWTRRNQYSRSDNQQPVTTYRTWTWLNLADMGGDMAGELSFEPADEIRLYEVNWAHGEVLMMQDGTLSVKEADEMPFFEWTEMKISHAEFGMCTADIMAHTQKVQSTLKRLIIDNQQMRNNTRYEAVVGALKNPRDLLDSRIGGVVWSRGIGSVAPLATPELSPMTMGIIQMLQSDGERRDGYSALGKGMNNDAIRYQNAESMVERLTTAGTRRPMMAARDWALTFLIPMCQFIVTLGIRNDKSQTQQEVRGRIIPVVPSQWSDDEMNMESAVALTPEEGKEHAQFLLTMHHTMMSDPELASIYKVPQKHALMDAVFDAMGVSDTTPYMNRPDSPEYQQAQQQAQQQMEQEKQKEEQLIQINLQLQQSGDRRAWEQFEWSKTQDMADANYKEQELDHTVANDNEKLSLGWAELSQKSAIDQQNVEIDEEELEIERTQGRPVGVGN